MPVSTPKSGSVAMSVDQTTDAPVIEAPRPRPMSLQLKVGLVITGSIVLLGLLAPWISPHPWDTISMRTRFVPPNATYWFGTDEYGRDVLSRLLTGTRLSLTMGVSATLVSLAVVLPLPPNFLGATRLFHLLS